MGFGHRVYKKGDSRVPVMREIGRELGKRTGKEQWIPICEKLEEVMDREKHLCANVDLYAAPVFWMLGFPPELNTPLFAASRVAGWCAHVTEQHDNNRLIRPRSLYIGPKMRPFPGSGFGWPSRSSIVGKTANRMRRRFAVAPGTNMLRIMRAGAAGRRMPEGLRIRSFPKNGEVVAEWKPAEKV